MAVSSVWQLECGFNEAKDDFLNDPQERVAYSWATAQDNSTTVSSILYSKHKTHCRKGFSDRHSDTQAKHIIYSVYINELVSLYTILYIYIYSILCTVYVYIIHRPMCVFMLTGKHTAMITVDYCPWYLDSP